MNEQHLQSYVEVKIFIAYLLGKEDIFKSRTLKRKQSYIDIVLSRKDDWAAEESSNRHYGCGVDDSDELEKLREANEKYRQALFDIKEAFADCYVEVSKSPAHAMEILKSRTFLLDLYRNIKKKESNLSNDSIAEIIDKAITRIDEAMKGEKKLTLKDIIDRVTEFVESGRMCFAFIKALMCENLLPKDDFDTAVKKINEMYEGKYKYKLDARDLSARMNTLSFRKHPSAWDIENAPVSGKRFSKYQNIANMTIELAKNLH